MIRKKKLEKGNEFVYLPDASNFKSLQKVYFLFVRNIKSDKYLSKQYIFVKNKDNLNKYQTVEDYEKDMSSQNFIGFDNFVIDDNLAFFREYSAKTEDKIIKMYNFFVKNEELYKRLLKYTKLFSDDNETFFWSKDFSNFRKNMFLYKCRFFLKLLFFIIIGTLKFLLYIPIFLIDILKSSINSYRIYKKKESKARFYQKNTFMNRALLNVSESVFESQKQQEENELEDLKEKYINSNIAMFTLIIAIGTMIFTLVENTKAMKQNREQNIENKKVILSIQEDNILLQNEIKIEKTKNQLLIELLNSTNTIDSKMEEKYTQLQEKLESKNLKEKK